MNEVVGLHRLYNQWRSADGEWLTGNAHQALRNLENIMVFLRATGRAKCTATARSFPRRCGFCAVSCISYADSLTHYARYALELFDDYFVGVLETDDVDGDLSNGTPNDVAIYGAFGRHGIGPGLAPNLKFF